MSTQVTTWPKTIYPPDTSRPAKSATRQGKAATEPLDSSSAAEHVAAIIFSAVFAAELTAIVAGLGLILTSLASLILQRPVR